MSGAEATVVDKEISFRGGSNSRNIGQSVDGDEVVESPSQNYGYIEDMAEEELVARPAVHGTTAGTGCILHGITAISDVSSRRWSTRTLLG